MFMTEDELKELTGWKRPKNVMQWLDENGYRYQVAGDGWPRVLKEAVYASLSVTFKPEPRMHL